MKTLYASLLSIFPLLSLFAQKIPDLGLNKVRILYEDRIVQAEIKPVKQIKNVLINRNYHWFSTNQINVTQGGFSGRLLNGSYTEFYLNKNLKMQGSYNKGLKTGIWKSWNENGKLLVAETWKNGLKNGTYKMYNGSGKIKEEGFYVNDLLQGAQITYTDSASTKVAYYDKGVLLPEKFSIWKFLFKKNQDTTKHSLSSQKKEASMPTSFIKPVYKTQFKASALHIVIVVALVIAILCSALIVTAYFYRLQYQKKLRYNTLQNNLESGVNLILASDSTSYLKESTFGLYERDDDSVSLQKLPWGLFEIGVVKAFKQKDTLFKSFSVGYGIDSLQWSAVHVIDEQRPLYIGGDSKIKGAAYLPKAGILEVFVEGRKYKGDKRLVVGPRRNSKSTLPPLRQGLLNSLKNSHRRGFQNLDSTFGARVVKKAFIHPPKKYFFNKRNTVIKDITLDGNVILYSDNQITIDSSAALNNILVFARSIKVRSGFTGRCQLFAVDSIVTEKNCRFEYPSVIGVLNFSTDTIHQSRISLGQNSVFNGVLFSYERKKSDVQTLIDIGENTHIKGQVFAQGMIRFKESAQVDGSISAFKLVYETHATLYENYLIDTHVDSENLSPYYLTSSLFSVSSKKKRVLQWLDSK